MCCAYKINKQSDNIQPWCTPFPIWNQSVVPCPVLTVASWPAYRFLKRQVRWSGIPISFRIFHNLLWSTQSILKEISPGISLEGMMLKLKLQYFGHLMRRVDSLEKTDAGRDWGQEEKGMTEDEMAGWHDWLDGHESEWTLGVGDGQGGLVCCDSWGRKELDTTKRLNWTELTESAYKACFPNHDIIYKHCQVSCYPNGYIKK